jgi:dTDP-4-amino-4,6-dideoxygalactose transaminase
VTPGHIPFIDLRPGEDDAAVRSAIDRVIARGWFVLGPEVEAFEAEFAAASGASYAVGVGSGTDAIALMLRAMKVKRGDEVIVPAITAAYTGLAVILAGGTPVFADVDPETLTLDPSACEAAITSRTVAIVPVHLYGQPAALQTLQTIAQRRSLAIVEDCCQAHLATCDGVPVGTRNAGLR